MVSSVLELIIVCGRCCPLQVVASAYIPLHEKRPFGYFFITTKCNQKFIHLECQTFGKNVCMPNSSKLLFKSHRVLCKKKTISAHGSHHGWRSWSPDTILKVYYPRTIHAMFALNWLTGFRGEDF